MHLEQSLTQMTHWQILTTLICIDGDDLMMIIAQYLSLLLG